VNQKTINCKLGLIVFSCDMATKKPEAKICLMCYTLFIQKQKKWCVYFHELLGQTTAC